MKNKLLKTLLPIAGGLLAATPLISLTGCGSKEDDIFEHTVVSVNFNNKFLVADKFLDVDTFRLKNYEEVKDRYIWAVVSDSIKGNCSKNLQSQIVDGSYDVGASSGSAMDYKWSIGCMFNADKPNFVNNDFISVSFTLQIFDAEEMEMLPLVNETLTAIHRES